MNKLFFNGSMYLIMSRLRNPDPGNLGLVKEVNCADLLLVEGNPLEDLKTVTEGDNLKIIMKDGKIYKSLVKQPNSQKERTRQ